MLLQSSKIQYRGKNKVSTKQLEEEFAVRLHDSIRQAQELGYNPSKFKQMLAELGALSLAKKLVLSSKLQHGLKEMVKLSRIDLAMESIMLEPKFKPLFSSGELEAAAWRLEQVQLT